jgi:hypothetical protein
LAPVPATPTVPLTEGVPVLVEIKKPAVELLSEMVPWEYPSATPAAKARDVRINFFIL